MAKALGIGGVSIRSKGRLPDHLHWQAGLLESDMPRRRVVGESGDCVVGAARVNGFLAAPTPITSSAWDGKR